VVLWVNGDSGRCTVILGCTASEHKFPAFIIQKVVQDGQIHRDFQQHVFKVVMYTQCNLVGGWMEKLFRNGGDSPYGEIHNNSLNLLLDLFSVHIQHNNIFALQQIGNCSRLAMTSTSFQRGTLPYCRYWIKECINPLNST
jgi:hypothetical protein